MSSIYTFPDQDVLAGTLSFEVETSSGSGTQSVMDKYFSEEVSINNATENLGGELRSATADIKVANDINNLFKDTILPVALTEGEWVTVKITLSGTILFYGKIEPSTISIDPFYAQNDALDGQQHEIKFRCIWIVDIAKLISKDDLASQLLTVASVGSKYVSPSGNYLYDGYTYVSIRDVIDMVFNLLNQFYGFTYQISYNLGSTTFYSKGDGLLNPQLYLFPTTGGAGIIDYGRFGNGVEPCLVHGKITAIYPDGKPWTVAQESGTLFFDSSDDTFMNAYEFFVGILKSFGLYCNIKHTATIDLDITISERTNGNPIVINDVLSSANNPMVEVGRKKINVTSVKSGNAYIKESPSAGASELSLQLPIDFGNDDDFCGTNSDGNTVNSAKSLVMPNGNSNLQLIRYAGMGDNIFVNAHPTTNLNGWTVESGTWVFDDGANLFAKALGRRGARLTLDTAFTREISQTLPESIYDGLIFGGWFSTNFVAVSGLVITISFYSGAVLMHRSTPSLTTTTGGLMFYLAYPAESGRRNQYFPITKVVVGITVNPAGSATDYLWMQDMFIRRIRKGTPEMVGMQVEDLFSDGNLSRKSKVLNGVQIVKPSDYFEEQGETFYNKSVTWNLSENETEIEAINYPY